MDEARSVRDFWFGPRPLSAQSSAAACASGSEASPRRCASDATRPSARRFAGLLERAAGGELAAWADGPRRRLSLIILLDQFPRNIYRGTARAFAHDTQALGLTLSGHAIGGGRRTRRGGARSSSTCRCSTPRAARCRTKRWPPSGALRTEAPRELQAFFESSARSAENHRAIIEQFGRFPHRNAILGRASTPAEAEWLNKGGASFGQ